jgi:hypothetical protein
MAAIPNSEKYKKTLPKDQQKLQDAAATSSVKTDTGSGGNPLKDAANTFGGEIATGSALLGAGKVTGINALKSLGTGTIRYSPHITAAVGGYKVGKKLDEKFDISGMMGDFYGPMLAKLQGADTNTGAITPEERLAIDSGRNPAVEQKGNIVQGPITPSERGAIDAGLNPNKPIENPMGLSTITGKYGAGNDDNVIAYEPLAQKSQEELATAATEDYASQFEGAYQNKDGSYTGLTTAGGEQSMTPEQYASYADQQKLGLGNPNAVPMGDYTPVAGTQGSVQQPLGYNAPVSQAPQAQQSPRDLAVAQQEARLEGIRGGEGLSDAARIATGQMEAPEGYDQRIPATGPYIPQAPVSQAPQAPQAPQMTKQMEAQGNFAERRDNGQPMTPEDIVNAQDFGASMGREFDPEKGYTSEFDPEILASYKARQEAGEFGAPRQRGLETDEQGRMRSTQADNGRSSYAKESAAREARMDQRSDFNATTGSRSDSSTSDFNQAQIRVGGKMVAGTPENREKRDLEKSLTEEARAADYTPAQTRQFVKDEMQKRSEATEDRISQKEMDDLNMTAKQASLAKTLKSMTEEESGLDLTEFKGIVTLLDQLGVSRDNQTGNLTYTDEDGGFAYFDKEVNLMPDSDLYQKILGMKGGDKFLAPPKGVQSQAKGQPEGTNVRADDGTGRIWKVTNGELVQVN